LKVLISLLSDIIDGEVITLPADLANNAVTSGKISDGEVKAEDLDPSIGLSDSEMVVHLVSAYKQLKEVTP
jgi:hypothetical protein